MAGADSWICKYAKKKMKLGENRIRIVKNVGLCKPENCAMIFERE